MKFTDKLVMNRNSYLKFRVFLFLVFFIFLLNLNQTAFSQTNSVEQILKKRGATKVSSTDNQFDLRGTILNLYYEGKEVVGIEAHFQKNESFANYEKTLKIFDEVKKLGSYLGSSNIGFVGPSGFVTRNIYFNNAVGIRTERTCKSIEVNSKKCKITRLKLYYWIPFEGIITDKTFEEFKINEKAYPKKYYIYIENLEIQVTEKDFIKLINGQMIKGKRVITRTPAVILESN